MSQKFHPTTYINQILKHLVLEFETASCSGTPSLIGSARENPARKRLEKLLPGISAVGSGLLIDDERNISKQQDVVIYEKDFCPVFTINDSPESTYYPCEGVIAVGEIKSNMGTKELEDAFEKISSAKKLKRYAKASNSISGIPTVAFRKYGSAISFEGAKEEEFNSNKEMDQIFGSVLCNNFNLQDDTLLKKSAKLWQQYPINESPNLIISLNNGFMRPGDINNQKSNFSIIGAKDIHYIKDSEIGFSALIRQLHLIIGSGRTVERQAFNRYFYDKNKTHCQTLRWSAFAMPTYVY